jgi:hypothetical protein
MGQANNSKRNATLDERKRRAAGRGDVGKPDRSEILDASGPDQTKGRTAGAFGRDMRANRHGQGGASAGEASSSLNTGRNRK